MNKNVKSENIIFIIHKGSRKNKCNICGKFFKEPGNLNTHKKIHSGDRPYKCSYMGCKKAFITMGNLRAHEDHHFGKKPFVCKFEGCGKKYSRQNRLEIHLRTHEGEKPYKCPFGGCDKSFNEKGNLKTHCRIHTGERPFVCKFDGCERAFKAHGHLKDHEKMHTNARPYKCHICFKSYGRSGILRNHLKTHEKKTKLGCGVCKMIFNDSNLLEEHKKGHFNTPDASQPTQVQEIKSAVDENVTISCNSNDVTPSNIAANNQFNLINVPRNFEIPNNTPISTPKNNNPNYTNNSGRSVKANESHFESSNQEFQNNNVSNSVPLTPINNNHHSSNRTHGSNTVSTPINSSTPTPMHNPFHLVFNASSGDMDDTPRTPFTTMETKIKKCLNSGQETISQDEANHLHDFYTNVLKKYMSLNKNELKYNNFISLFKEYISNKDNKYSLNDVLNLLNLDRACFNEAAASNGIQHTPQLGYNLTSPRVMNGSNVCNISFDIGTPNTIRNIFDSSPRFPVGYSAFSPIFQNNYQKYSTNVNGNYFNSSLSNANTTRNVNGNVFSAPRNTGQKNMMPTFSDYLNLYK